MKRRALIIAVSLLVVSCARQAGPTTYPVTGTVMMNGQPVTEALVVFTPKDGGDDSALASQAETDGNGKFEMRTYLGEDDYRAGMQPGDYVVTVTKLEVIRDMRRQPKNLLPRRYSLPKTTNLTATVNASSDNVIQLVLE